MAFDVAGALTKKYGPLPGWAWAAGVGGAGVLALHFLGNKQASTVGAGTSYAGPGGDTGAAPPPASTVPYPQPSGSPNVTPSGPSSCGPGTKYDPASGACLPAVSVSPPPPNPTAIFCDLGMVWDASQGRCVWPIQSTNPNAPSNKAPTVAPPAPGTPGYAPGAGSTVPSAPIGDPNNYGPCGAFYSVALGRNMPRGSGAPGDPGCPQPRIGVGFGGPARTRRNQGMPHVHLGHRSNVALPHYVRAMGGPGRHYAELERVAGETGVHPARLRILNPSYTGLIRVA